MVQRYPAKTRKCIRSIEVILPVLKYLLYRERFGKTADCRYSTEVY